VNVPLKVWATAALLAFAGLTCLSLGLSNPPQLYYDEPQYVASARALLTSSPNPNPEAPPLGKLLIAGGIRIFGDNPTGWRFPGALFGALTLAGVFLWAYLLLDDYGLALIAAVLTLLNNFLFVMSRVAMMDVFLVGFVVWGLIGFTAALKVDGLTTLKTRILLIFSGIMFGFGCACKWNGVDSMAATAGLVAWFWFLRPLNTETSKYKARFQQIGISYVAASLFLVPIVSYCLTYWPLCRSLHQRFGFRELAAMNLFIWRFHRAVHGNPAIVSGWYTWPLQVAPQRALSYLVGNWFIMWTGLAAVVVCGRRFLKTMPETFIVLLYVANLLQWAVTPQSCLYYYYYFPAATFLGIAIPLGIQQVQNRTVRSHLMLVSVSASVCVFTFCFAHMAHLGPPYDTAFGYWV
jgi:dolichyl-phosphate-mannose--protein O-mannosyl transferase